MSLRSLYAAVHFGRRTRYTSPRRGEVKEFAVEDLRVGGVSLILSLSGGRISEILALTPAALDIDSGVANITT
jgi:hypothetical protein